MGTLIFHNDLAGEFIITLAWICPFLYLSTTLNSILNGLGKTTITLIHSLASIMIRILFVVICIPRFGIQGYLWGILIGQLVITFLNFIVLSHFVRISISFYRWIVIPIGVLCIAICFGIYTNALLTKLSKPYELLNVGISCLGICAVYFLILFLLKFFPRHS